MPEIKIEQELPNNKDNLDIMRELSLNLNVNQKDKSKSNSPPSRHKLINENLLNKKYYKIRNEAENAIKIKLKLNNFKQKIINCYNLNIPIENGYKSAYEMHEYQSYSDNYMDISEYNNLKEFNYKNRKLQTKKRYFENEDNQLLNRENNLKKIMMSSLVRSK